MEHAMKQVSCKVLSRISVVLGHIRKSDGLVCMLESAVISKNTVCANIKHSRYFH